MTYRSLIKGRIKGQHIIFGVKEQCTRNFYVLKYQ